jgi:hypothetical protein
MAFIKIGDAYPISAVYDAETMDHEKTEQALNQVKEQLTEEDKEETKKVADAN